MELWENVILTGYLLWGSWYDIRKRAVPVGVLFLGGVLAVMVIVWKGFECSRLVLQIPYLPFLLAAYITAWMTG